MMKYKKKSDGKLRLGSGVKVRINDFMSVKRVGK